MDYLSGLLLSPLPSLSHRSYTSPSQNFSSRAFALPIPAPAGRYHEQSLPTPRLPAPSRTHRGSGVLVCRDQNRPTRTTSANFEQESEEPFLAAPPTRRGISGKAEEGVGLDSYTSQRAAARSDLAMHQSKLSSFI